MSPQKIKATISIWFSYIYTVKCKKKYCILLYYISLTLAWCFARKTLNATNAVIHLRVSLHSITCSVLIAQIHVIVHSQTNSFQGNKRKKEKNSLKRPQPFSRKQTLFHEYRLCSIIVIQIISNSSFHLHCVNKFEHEHLCQCIVVNEPLSVYLGCTCQLRNAVRIFDNAV